MKYRECALGRVFVVRLEDGDRLPDSIEEFAASEGVLRAMVTAVGGVESGRIVVGPEKTDTSGGVKPMTLDISGVHEAAGVGTIFPDESGKPVLHMHAAMGREGTTRTGCVRTGLNVWKVLEVMVIEIIGNEPTRRRDAETGFELLEP